LSTNQTTQRQGYHSDTGVVKPFSLDSVIRRNYPTIPSKIVFTSGELLDIKRYVVPRTYQILTTGLLLKSWDQIHELLKDVLGLTTARRKVVFSLLRYHAYYAYVCPKEATITEEPGCSKATFWRTIKVLEELGLINVVNRYLIRPHAQISNQYHLPGLLLVIARYLAEHGIHFLEHWLQPVLNMSGSLFWGSLSLKPGARASPP